MDWTHVVSAELARLAMTVLLVIILYNVGLLRKELRNRAE